jgi:hypothetical protein
MDLSLDNHVFGAIISIIMVATILVDIISSIEQYSATEIL